MNTLKFNFGHPVKGNAVLIQQFIKKPNFKKFRVDSNGSDFLEIPVSSCADGKWKMILDWEYDNRMFSHIEEFEVKNSTGTTV